MNWAHAMQLLLAFIALVCAVGVIIGHRIAKMPLLPPPDKRCVRPNSTEPW